MTGLLMMMVTVLVVLPYLLLQRQPDWPRQDGSAADADAAAARPLLLRNPETKPNARTVDSSRTLTSVSPRTRNLGDGPLGRDRTVLPPLPPPPLPLVKTQILDLQVRLQNLALATIEDRARSNLAAGKPAAARP